MKRLLFAFCVLFSTQMLSAQIISSKQVTIRQPEKIEKPKKNFKIEKGYRGFVEGAYTLNLNGNPVSGFDVLTTHGYQFNEWVFLGGGIGFCGAYGVNDIITEKRKIGLSMPAYANIRIYCSRKKVKPFIDAKAGYLVPLKSATSMYQNPESGGWTNMLPPLGKNEDDWAERHNVKLKYSGLYSQIGFGLEIGPCAFSLNYTLRGYKQICHILYIDSQGGEDYTVSDIYKGYNPFMFTFNFGVNF